MPACLDLVPGIDNYSRSRELKISNPSAAIGTPIKYENGRVHAPGELVARERVWKILGDVPGYS